MADHGTRRSQPQHRRTARPGFGAGLQQGVEQIVLLSRLHGVPAPVNELLQRLANEFARDRRAPGSITDDEVAAILSDQDRRSQGSAPAPA